MLVSAPLSIPEEIKRVELQWSTAHFTWLQEQGLHLQY